MNKKQSLAMLFTAWPPTSNDKQTVEQLSGSYELALMYCHPEFVKRAITAFVQGRVDGHNMAFRPTPPQIAQWANKAQNEDDRIKEISNRVDGQRKQIEYQKAPKEVRDRQVELWQRIKAELRKPNIAELSDVYVRDKISPPGTVFDPLGAHFPDGTHHSIEEMRKRVGNQVDSRQSGFRDWDRNPQRWNDRDELAASMDRIRHATGMDESISLEDEL